MRQLFALVVTAGLGSVGSAQCTCGVPVGVPVSGPIISGPVGVPMPMPGTVVGDPAPVYGTPAGMPTSLPASMPGVPSVPGVPAVPTVGGDGVLHKLNQPFVPGVPSLPGVPVPSPLGLLAPRLSFFDRYQQLGGMANPEARIALVGTFLPRVAPVISLIQGGVPTPQAGFTTGLSILAPRLATGVLVAQEYRKTGQSVLGGGGQFHRGGSGCAGCP